MSSKMEAFCALKKFTANHVDLLIFWLLVTDLKFVRALMTDLTDVDRIAFEESRGPFLRMDF